MIFFNVINWRTISFFGKNRLVIKSYTYLIIVPILAKLLSKMKTPMELSFGGETIEIVLSLPFNWKIFFFSALLFSIGSLMYSLFAPEIIKENKSFGDFLAANKGVSHLYDYREDLNISSYKLSKKGVDTKEIIKESVVYDRNSDYHYSKHGWRQMLSLDSARAYALSNRLLKEKEKTKEEKLKLTFWLLFNYAKVSRKLLLFITSIMFFSGFILILIVLIQNIIEVVKWV